MAPFFRRKRAAEEHIDEQEAPVATPTEGTESDEASPLADRLRHMDWPTPTDDVRERCLQEIMARVGDGGPDTSDDEDDAPGADSRHAAG